MVLAVTAVCMLCLVIGAVGSVLDDKPPTASTAGSEGQAAEPTRQKPSDSPSPSPSAVAMPSLVGKNGRVAEDELKRLGFTNIEFGSVDREDTLVILPENWKVAEQSPPAGQRVSTDGLVVLGCTKQR